MPILLNVIVCNNSNNNNTLNVKKLPNVVQEKCKYVLSINSTTKLKAYVNVPIL